MAVVVVHGSVLAGKVLGDCHSVTDTDGDGDDTVKSGLIPLTGPALVRFPGLRLPETVSGLLFVEELLSVLVWRSSRATVLVSKSPLYFVDTKRMADSKIAFWLRGNVGLRESVMISMAAASACEAFVE